MKIEEFEAKERTEPSAQNEYGNQFNVNELVQRIDFKIAELEAMERDDSFVGLYAKIQYDLSEKQYDSAIASLNALLSEKPKEAVLYKMLSDCYYSLGDKLSAIETLTNAFEITEDESILEKAISIHQLNSDHEKMIVEYSKLIERNNHAVVFYMKRADAYVELGKYEEAISDISYVIMISPNKSAALFKRGLIYSKSKDYTRAIDDYTDAYELDAVSTYLFERSKVFLSIKKYESAIEDISTIIKESPNSPVLYSQRGETYYQLGEYQKAINDYTKAYELKPDPYYLLNRGFVYCDVNYDSAIKDFSSALSDANLPDELRSTCLNNRGYCYVKKMDFDAALSDLHEAINIDEEDDPAPYKNLGVVMFEQEDFPKALEYLNKAIEIDVKYVPAYIERVKIYEALGEYANAQDDRNKIGDIEKNANGSA